MEFFKRYNCRRFKLKEFKKSKGKRLKIDLNYFISLTPNRTKMTNYCCKVVFWWIHWFKRFLYEERVRELIKKLIKKKAIEFQLDKIPNFKLRPETRSTRWETNDWSPLLTFIIFNKHINTWKKYILFLIH